MSLLSSSSSSSAITNDNCVGNDTIKNGNNAKPYQQGDEEDKPTTRTATRTTNHDHAAATTTTTSLLREVQQQPEQQQQLSWRTETMMFLHLALPTVMIQLGFVIPSFLAASYVGRKYGPVYLDGFQLANCTVNLFTFSLLQGLFTATDTLSPQAYGAGNYKEVGLVAIRGFIASMTVVVLPVGLLLLFTMKDFLANVCGQDPRAAQAAADWYAAFVATLPCFAFYEVLWKFLSCQGIMMPMVLSVVVCCSIILPSAMEFCTRTWGYLGSAYAVVIFYASQPAIVLTYVTILRPHNKSTWPTGMLSRCWREVFRWAPFGEYFYLAAGGMIASSEWIYWETLSLGVGQLGVVPLSVHAVATQAITLSFMLPLGIGIALSIRLGNTLPNNVSRAKKLVFVSSAICTILFGAISILMYRNRETIFYFFVDANEREVLDASKEIWDKVCLYNFFVSEFAIVMGIATGLGMQWTLGIATLVVLWVVGLPGAWYFGIVRAQSLCVVWSWIYPPYVAMDLILLIAFTGKDWDSIREHIRTREGMEEEEVIEGKDDNGNPDDNTDQCCMSSSNVDDSIPRDYGSTMTEERRELLLNNNGEQQLGDNGHC